MLRNMDQEQGNRFLGPTCWFFLVCLASTQTSFCTKFSNWFKSPSFTDYVSVFLMWEDFCGLKANREVSTPRKFCEFGMSDRKCEG